MMSRPASKIRPSLTGKLSERNEHSSKRAESLQQDLVCHNHIMNTTFSAAARFSDIVGATSKAEAVATAQPQPEVCRMRQVAAPMRTRGPSRFQLSLLLTCAADGSDTTWRWPHLPHHGKLVRKPGLALPQRDADWSGRPVGGFGPRKRCAARVWQGGESSLGRLFTLALQPVVLLSSLAHLAGLRRCA
jgi:hypothetical protein